MNDSIFWAYGLSQPSPASEIELSWNEWQLERAMQHAQRTTEAFDQLEVWAKQRREQRKQALDDYLEARRSRHVS